MENQLWPNEFVLNRSEASFRDAHTVVVRKDSKSPSVAAANVLVAVAMLSSLGTMVRNADLWIAQLR